jgi:RimJ/RimL family protein N-acetyltransferase
MTEPIDWNTHQDWLASVLNAPTKSLLIGQREGSPVGVVRFDTAGADAEISIYLVPGLHPPGEGRSLLQSAERWLTSNRPEVDRICAHVLAGNERSGRLFLGAGYQADSSIYSKRLGGR